MTEARPPDTITWLDDATVRTLLPGWAEQVRLLTEMFRAMADGQVENPPKIGVHARPDTFVNAMPAYVGGRDVTAVKWIAAYPPNPARGLPYISGLIVLNDSATGLPVAIMDAAALTATRTAAVSGVSLQHLAHPGWRRVAILGYGAQGRAHAAMVRVLHPEATMVVYGGPRRRDPEPEVTVVGDARAAVEGADVVVTAGPMAPDPSRRLDPSWLSERVLVLPVDFDAYVGADVAGSAEDLVTDDIAQFALYRDKGHFVDWPAPHRSLGEAVDDPPRGGLRVSCSLGVGAADAVLADEVWRRAQQRGLGIALPR